MYNVACTCMPYNNRVDKPDERTTIIKITFESVFWLFDAWHVARKHRLINTFILGGCWDVLSHQKSHSIFFRPCTLPNLKWFRSCKKSRLYNLNLNSSYSYCYSFEFIFLMCLSFYPLKFATFLVLSSQHILTQGLSFLVHSCSPALFVLKGEVQHFFLQDWEIRMAYITRI